MSAADLRRTSNLRVLQRLDSQIVDLAISSTHVVLYQFSPQSSTWNKTDIEGPLFIVKRSCSPRFKLIVMNRNSQENLEVGVNGTMEMQLREPYLIFRDNNNSSNNNNNSTTSDETIRGLWFHNDNERKSVHTYLENVVKSLSKIEEMERNAFVPPALAVTTGAAGNDANGGSAAGSNTGGSGGEKGQKTNVVVPEVNTNAAGAALLSTLTLNSNSAQKKQPQSSSSAASATKSNNSHQQSNSNTANANSNTSNVNALDKKSLQLALLSLIQEDRFLDLLHAQYLKVVRAHHNQQQQQQQQQQQKSRKIEE
ncbi:hypothetical protein ACHAWC_011251 [Mediolabrus comicus]